MHYKPRHFHVSVQIMPWTMLICLPYRKFNMTLPKRKDTEVFTSMHIHTDIIYAKHTFAKYAVSQRQNNVHFFGFTSFCRLWLCLLLATKHSSLLTSLSSLSTRQLVVLFGTVGIFIAWRSTLDDKILVPTLTMAIHAVIQCKLKSTHLNFN